LSSTLVGLGFVAFCKFFKRSLGLGLFFWYIPFSLSSTLDLVGAYLLTLSLHSKVPSELVHEKSFLTFVGKVWAFQVKLQLGGFFFFLFSFWHHVQFCDAAEVAIIDNMMMMI
jgi:hypothetical protein